MRNPLRISAVAVAAWWLMLAAVPASRPWFLPSSNPDLDPAFSAFAIPDLLVVSLASLVAALPGPPVEHARRSRQRCAYHRLDR